MSNRLIRMPKSIRGLSHHHVHPLPPTYWPVAAFQLGMLTTWPNIKGDLEPLTVEQIRSHEIHDFASSMIRVRYDYSDVFGMSKQDAQDSAFTARVLGKDLPILCLPGGDSSQFKVSIIFNPDYTPLEEPQVYTIRSSVYGHLPITELRSNRILIWGRNWYGDPIIGECRDVLAHTAQVALDSMRGIHTADVLGGLKRDVFVRGVQKHAGDKNTLWNWWRHIGPCEDCFHLVNQHSEMSQHAEGNPDER